MTSYKLLVYMRDIANISTLINIIPVAFQLRLLINSTNVS